MLDPNNALAMTNNPDAPYAIQRWICVPQMQHRLEQVC
jgi:hypothetical protein